MKKLHTTRPAEKILSVGRAMQESMAYHTGHQPAGRGDGAPLYDLTDNGIYPADIYSPKGVQYYGTGYRSLDQVAMRIILSCHHKPNASVTIYRAVHTHITGDINAGDWVTIIRQYAQQHGVSVLNGDYKILTRIVAAKTLYTSGDSFLEWGYWP